MDGSLAEIDEAYESHRKYEETMNKFSIDHNEVRTSLGNNYKNVIINKIKDKSLVADDFKHRNLSPTQKKDIEKGLDKLYQMDMRKS